MNKDPAVLLYTADFITEVSDLTMQERGEYITLLCLQHQKGHLSEKAIMLALGSMPSPDVMKRFCRDSAELYFNPRMDEEIKKRREYAESRRRNGAMGGRPRKQKEVTEKDENHMQNHMQNHMGNENTNENISESIIENVNADALTTTTTKNNYISLNEESGEKDARELVRTKQAIHRYFDEHMYISSPDNFITYNEARGWRGVGGECVLDNFETYADEWEKNERIKKRMTLGGIVRFDAARRMSLYRAGVSLKC